MAAAPLVEPTSVPVADPLFPPPVAAPPPAAPPVLAEVDCGEPPGGLLTAHATDAPSAATRRDQRRGQCFMREAAEGRCCLALRSCRRCGSFLPWIEWSGTAGCAG